MIHAAGLSYTVGDKYLVKNASVIFRSGEVVAVMGPNGAGKTTLLKMLAGGLSPTSGTVFLKEKHITQYSAEQLALERAVLSQAYQINFPITTDEVIMMGRYPHFQNVPSVRDEAILVSVIDTLGIDYLRNRDYATLSGGEAQKVQMARVLAQVWPEEGKTGKALFLDEPVSSLDIKYQHEMLSVARLFAKKGNAVIAILHDLNLALEYADRIYFMKDAGVCYEYQSQQTLDLTLLHSIFNIEFEILSAANNRPFVRALAKDELWK